MKPAAIFRAKRDYKQRSVIPARERISKFIFPVTESGCWIWMGNLDGGGYGAFRLFEKGMQKAHRVVWELHNGPLSPEVKLLHRCDVRCCVNPDHMFIGTQIDNIRDMWTKGRGPDTRGNCNGRSKLTESDVLYIRKSSATLHELAKQFRVGKSTIGYVRSRTTWAHIP